MIIPLSVRGPVQLFRLQVSESVGGCNRDDLRNRLWNSAVKECILPRNLQIIILATQNRHGVICDTN